MTKGIILSGGSGSRLHPLTSVVNKQLLPVYDKPMIYYPLSTLIKKGIKDICIISTPVFIQHYLKLLIDSSELGLNIQFRVQEEPKGIAEALIIAEDFISKDPCCLILGDNIFHGAQRFNIQEDGATIFGYLVKEPSHYGVVEFDSKGKAISLEEKPEQPKSSYAVPGVYFYDKHAAKYAKKLKPSSRGELEITDLNKVYLDRGELNVVRLNRGFVWLDVGMPSNLHQAACYIQMMQERQGISIGCIEEDCYRAGFINKKQLKGVTEEMPEGEYKEHLLTL
jgi:glucose-1-phosphate thymidylyltransferase